MGLLTTILLGAFVGWIASIITKRDAEQGWVGNILVGIGGSLIANLLFNGGNLVLDLSSLVVALIGAVILCLVLNFFQNTYNKKS